MATDINVNGEDVPIEKLVPLNKRKTKLKTSAGFRKIVSSIEVLGLIEPLCVYRENGNYVILDGFLRYKACQELGITVVPCLLFRDKEAYTYNRMVNRLSPVQEIRMLRKSLETLDQSTIAQVFGLKTIQYRLGTALMSQLHQSVVEALDRNLVGRQCAQELTHVKHARQVEILAEMEKTGDYSMPFARTLVLKTPASLRIRKKGKRKSPWQKQVSRKRELVAKLEEIEKRHDFHTNVYNQYSTDLLRLVSYVRKLITNESLRSYLTSRYAEILQRFEGIVFETDGDGPDS